MFLDCGEGTMDCCVAKLFEPEAGCSLIFCLLDCAKGVNYQVVFRACLVNGYGKKSVQRKKSLLIYAV